MQIIDQKWSRTNKINKKLKETLKRHKWAGGHLPSHCSGRVVIHGLSSAPIYWVAKLPTIICSNDSWKSCTWETKHMASAVLLYAIFAMFICAPSSPEWSERIGRGDFSLPSTTSWGSPVAEDASKGKHNPTLPPSWCWFSKSVGVVRGQIS